MRFSEFFLIALECFLRRKWCTTSIGYLNIFSLKAVTIFIISRKILSGLVSLSFDFAGQNNRACHLARRPSGGFGRYLFCAWENHKCTAKMKKYGIKPHIHQFLTDLKFGNGCTKLVDISRDIGECSLRASCGNWIVEFRKRFGNRTTFVYTPD